MRYIAAYLLSVLGGVEQPTAADVKKILGSVGASVDDERLNKLIGELKGKNLEELIAAGMEKMAKVPAGGAAPAAAAGAAAPVEEAKEEEKKEEPEEESDDDMGFGLFD